MQSEGSRLGGRRGESRGFHPRGNMWVPWGSSRVGLGPALGTVLLAPRAGCCPSSQHPLPCTTGLPQAVIFSSWGQAGGSPCSQATGDPLTSGCTWDIAQHCRGTGERQGHGVFSSRDRDQGLLGPGEGAWMLPPLCLHPQFLPQPLPVLSIHPAELPQLSCSAGRGSKDTKAPNDSWSCLGPSPQLASWKQKLGLRPGPLARLHAAAR